MTTANIYYPGEILEQTELSLEWADMRSLTYHPRVVHTRSKGVHVSGIIKVIAEKRKLYKAGDDVDDMPTVVLLGTAFEEKAVQLYNSLEWQPGEVKRDGIAGSPDGRHVADIGELEDWYFFASDTVRILDEFKLTYKSLRYRQDIRAEVLWMMQVMDYLWMDEEVYRASDGYFYARLHVLWACSDYVMPFRPRYIRYLLRFTQEELERNWAMMLKYKQFAVREG